jgi:RimJ/RimL family protein N-acetyltransferase
MLEIDLERLRRWLNAPHVNRWWSRRPLTREEVRAKYLPRLRGKQPMHCVIAVIDSHAAGFVQTYRIDDYAQYTPAFRLPSGGWGIDWFIGEPDWIGKGHGAPLLDAFVRGWLWPRREVAYAVAGAGVDNLAALRCYERAEFRPWFSTPPRATAERYYRRDRRDGEGWSTKKK